MKILCILTTVLGNATVSNMVRGAVSRLEDVDATFLEFGQEDFRTYRAPSYLRISQTAETIYVCRKRFARIDADFDAVIIHGGELAIALGYLIKKHPTVLAFDQLSFGPYNISPKPTNLLGRLKRDISSRAVKAAYGRIIPRCRFLLPQSNWSAEPVYRHFKFDPERIAIMRLGLDLDRWKVRVPVQGEPLRILFVGNDFLRKGGDILLEAFAAIGDGNAILTIISNDKYLSSRSLPEGVRHLRSIPHEQMADYYSSADVFVLPTRQDTCAWVVSEAAASGLAILTTNVGGVAELIEEGGNGYILSATGAAKDCADRLLELSRDRAKLERFCQRSRAIAEETLSFSRFEQIIRRSVDALRDAASTR